MRTPLLVTSASFVLALAVMGCGDDEAHIKELSRYTPEILAEEMLTRYKATLRGKRAEKPVAKTKGSAKGNADGDKETSAAAKYGDEVRSHDSQGASKGMSPDELARNVAKKVKLIEGASREQVFAKLGAAVDGDAELKSGDKETLKASLEKARAE
jgi:hypothetical protein